MSVSYSQRRYDLLRSHSRCISTSFLLHIHICLCRAVPDTMPVSPLHVFLCVLLFHVQTYWPFQIDSACNTTSSGCIARPFCSIITTIYNLVMTLQTAHLPRPLVRHEWTSRPFQMRSLMAIPEMLRPLLFLCASFILSTHTHIS